MDNVLYIHRSHLDWFCKMNVRKLIAVSNDNIIVNQKVIIIHNWLWTNHWHCMTNFFIILNSTQLKEHSSTNLFTVTFVVLSQNPIKHRRYNIVGQIVLTKWFPVFKLNELSFSSIEMINNHSTKSVESFHIFNMLFSFVWKIGVSV